MNPFDRHTGIGAPLLRPNIDTDVIAPLNRSSSRGGEPGAMVFESLRYREDGSENPDFILNRPAFRDASILLTGRNFGTGSSRESAVTGLMALGFRCVIAPSFGEIFYKNCFSNGMLPVTMEIELVEHLAGLVHDNPERMITADLEKQAISHPGLDDSIYFEINARLKRKMLLGLEDIDELLLHDEDLTAFQSLDRQRRPWVYNWN